MNEEELQRYLQLRSQGASHEDAISRIRGRAGVTGKVSDTLRGILSGASKVVPGAASGLGFVARKAGEATGIESLERAGRGTEEFSRYARERAERYYDPRGAAGRAGEFVGRLGGEVAFAVPSIMAGGAGLARVAPSVANLGQGSAVQRALYGVAVEAPLTAAQAARTASEGGNVPLDVLLNVAGSGIGGALTRSRARPPATTVADEPAEEAVRETVEQAAEAAPRVSRREADLRIQEAAGRAEQPREIPEIRTAEPLVAPVGPRRARTPEEQARRMEELRESQRKVDERRLMEERERELEAIRAAEEVRPAAPEGIEVVRPRNVIPEETISGRRELAEGARSALERSSAGEAVEEVLDEVAARSVDEALQPIVDVLQETETAGGIILPRRTLGPRTPERQARIDETLGRAQESELRRQQVRESAERAELLREENRRRAAQSAAGRGVLERLQESSRMLEGAEDAAAAQRRLEEAARQGGEEAAARAAGERGLDLYTFPGPVGQALRSQAGQSVVGGALGASIGAGITPEEGDPLGGAFLGGVAGLLAPQIGARALRFFEQKAGRAARPAEAAETAAEDAGGILSEIRRERPYEGPVDPEDYYNPGNYQVGSEVEQGLRQAMEDVVRQYDVPLRDPDTGQLLNPETWDDVERAADRVIAEYGVSPTEVVRRTRQGERLSDVEILAVDKEITRYITEQNAIYQRLSTPGLDPEETARLGLEMGRIRNNLDALLTARPLQRTFRGRGLNLEKKRAFMTKDLGVWVARAQDLARRPLNDFEMARVGKLVEEDKIDELVKFIGERRKSTLGEKFIAYFKSGLLTQPSTHLANIGGNTGMRALEDVKDVPAVIIDRMLSRLTGAETKALVASSRRGAALGVQEARKAMRGLPSGLQDMSKWDLVRETNFDSVLGNIFVKGVFRLLDSQDRFFRGVAFTKSLEEQATVIGRNAGYRGDELAAFVANKVARPSDDMVARAIGNSEYAVFQNNSRLARAAVGARSFLQNQVMKDLDPTSKTYQLVDAAVHVLFPFTKTPANLAAVALDYSPAGILQGANKLVKVLADAELTSQRRATLQALEAAGEGGNARALAKSVAESDKLQREAAEALSRGGVGTLGLLAGWALYQNGMATGFYPADQRERNEWRATGKQEGSIKVGDSWLNVSRIAPLGNLFMIGAEMAKISEMSDASITERAFGIATAPVRAVTELPMLSGLGDITETISTLGTPEALESIGRLGGRSLHGALPVSGILRGLAYGTDPYVRETRAPDVLSSIRRQFAAQVPGASQTLPRRVSPTGEYVMRPGAEGPVAGRLLRATSDPFRVTEDITESDPLLAEVDRLGVSLPRLERRNGESDEQYEQRALISGAATRRSLEALMMAPQYQLIANLPTERLRMAAQSLGADIEGVSDEELRARLQRYVMESVASRARSAVSSAFPNPMGGQVGGIMRSLERR